MSAGWEPGGAVPAVTARVDRTVGNAVPPPAAGARPAKYGRSVQARRPRTAAGTPRRGQDGRGRCSGRSPDRGRPGECDRTGPRRAGTLPAPTTLFMPAPVLAGVENFASPLPLTRQAGAKSSTAGRIGERWIGGIFVHRHLEEPGPGLRGSAAVRVNRPKRRERMPGKNTRCRTRAALAFARASGAATGASTASTRAARTRLLAPWIAAARRRQHARTRSRAVRI